VTFVRIANHGADRRRGWLAVLGGALLALAVQIAAPVGVPLYDGVLVQEPYRFLHPTGDQAGSPTTGSDTELVEAGTSPILVVNTTENPPQAQLIAQDGAFQVADGVTKLLAKIAAIEAPAPPTGGTIAGNVYRFSVTDQAGNPVGLTTCDGCRSLILRAPDPTIEATVKRYADGAWTDVPTDNANLVGFQVNPTVLGDYAVIEKGPDASAGPGASASQGTGEGRLGLDGSSPVVLIGGGVLVLLLVAGLFLLLRVRQAPRATPSAPGRIPSKRKPPRRPPPPPPAARST
jgi:hypothetical protein